MTEPVPICAAFMLPEHMRESFPAYEGTMPPHVTLLYAKVPTESVPLAVEALRTAAAQVDPSEPVRLALAGVGYFDNPEQRVAFAQVGASPSARALRRDFLAQMAASGVAAEQTHAGWVPHSTLAILPPGGEYEGPSPLAICEPAHIELWIGKDGVGGKHAIPLGAQTCDCPLHAPCPHRAAAAAMTPVAWSRTKENTMPAPDRVSLDMAPQAIELGRRVDVLRVGPIYDPRTGAKVGQDITAELAREAAAGANAFIAAGNAIPVSIDHGIEQGMSDPAVPAERRKSYGAWADFAFDEDRQVVTAELSLNEAGLAYVAGHQTADGEDEADDAKAAGNSLRVSPYLHFTPLHDTRTGAPLAKAWIEVVSLTNVPRQDGLAPVMLSRGAAPGMLLGRIEPAAADVGGPLGTTGQRAVRETVERAVLGELRRLGLHRPEGPGEDGGEKHERVETYAYLLDFDAGRALVKVCPASWTPERADRVFMLPIAHGSDGSVEVTGPPVEGRIVESFAPLDAPPAPGPLMASASVSGARWPASVLAALNGTLVDPAKVNFDTATLTPLPAARADIEAAFASVLAAAGCTDVAERCDTLQRNDTNATIPSIGGDAGARRDGPATGEEDLMGEKTGADVLLSRTDAPGSALLARLGLDDKADGAKLAAAITARLDEADKLKAADAERVKLAREAEADALLDAHKVEGAERGFFRVSLLSDGEAATLARATLAERGKPDRGADIDAAILAGKKRGALPADFVVKADVMALARTSDDGAAGLIAAIEALPDGHTVRVGPAAGSTQAGMSDPPAPDAAKAEAALLARADEIRDAAAKANAPISLGVALSRAEAELPELVRARNHKEPAR